MFFEYVLFALFRRATVKAEIGDYIRAQAYDHESHASAEQIQVIAVHLEAGTYELGNGGVISDAEICLDDVLLESEIVF